MSGVPDMGIGIMAAPLHRNQW